MKGGLLANFQGALGIHRAIKLDELGYQPGPAGLMAGAQSGTVVAVEVFVEQDVVTPVGIALESFRAAIHRPPAMLVAGEYPSEPVADLFANLEEVRHNS